MTTYPPLVSANSYWDGDTTLTPQAGRDSDTLDCGYHYWPLDYVLKQTAVTNATLRLAPGTVLGVYGGSGTYGVALLGGGSLLSQGTATDPVRIVRYNTVQEESASDWATADRGALVCTAWFAVSGSPGLDCRFTQWSALANDGELLWASTSGTTWTAKFRDNGFHGRTIETDEPTLEVNNCLFDRVYLALYDLGA